jgi:hypothetical protein
MSLRLPSASTAIPMRRSEVVAMAKQPKPIWSKRRPSDLGKPAKLSLEVKASAKSAAKSAGRPYPNLVDNMRAARTK